MKVVSEMGHPQVIKLEDGDCIPVLVPASENRTCVYLEVDIDGKLIIIGGASIISSIEGEGMKEKIQASGSCKEEKQMTTPEQRIVLDDLSLMSCLECSIVSRNQYIDNLINSTKGKEVVVTEEFRNGLFQAMIHPESQAPQTVDGWFTDTYLTLSQKLGIEYTPEELREIMFKNQSIPLGVGLVLTKVIEMGVKIEPEEIGEYLKTYDMKAVAKNNLFGDKTSSFIESRYASCMQRIEDTKQKIIERTKEVKEFKARLEEYMRRYWFYRRFHKPPEKITLWPHDSILKSLQYDKKVLLRCIKMLNMQPSG